MHFAILIINVIIISFFVNTFITDLLGKNFKAQLVNLVVVPIACLAYGTLLYWVDSNQWYGLGTMVLLGPLVALGLIIAASGLAGAIRRKGRSKQPV